jgi:hypothetical protein
MKITIMSRIWKTPLAVTACLIIIACGFLVFAQVEIAAEAIRHKWQQAEYRLIEDLFTTNPQKVMGNGDSNQTDIHLTKEQIQSLINKEFGQLFLVDSLYISPTYLVGDFNGDGIKDLAVLVRPRKTIDPNDKTKPTFWLDEPITGGIYKTTSKRRLDKAEREWRERHQAFTIGDLARYRQVLLPEIVIIHGTEGRMWENSEPQQRFVVLGGMDHDADRMRLYRGKLKSMAIGDSPGGIPHKLVGDALLFTYRNEGGAVIYWLNGDYYWYPWEP